MRRHTTALLRVVVVWFCLGTLLQDAFAFSSTLLPSKTTTTTTHILSTTTTALQLSKYRRGLETRRESATPTEGGMTLYLKAGPDGTSVGDCPFAHYVRMVLEVKELEYDLQPAVQETKPSWLIEYYQGKMPALRHNKECYVESDTIANYLDFFFPQPNPLTAPVESESEAAVAAMDGFFPALAQYVKHTPDGDPEDDVKKETLFGVLETLNAFLANTSRTGPYLVGDGTLIRLQDCQLAPKLYHMKVAVEQFKGTNVLEELYAKFPALQQYMEYMFESDASFKKTVYPPEVVVWGWSNARS